MSVRSRSKWCELFLPALWSQYMCLMPVGIFFLRLPQTHKNVSPASGQALSKWHDTSVSCCSCTEHCKCTQATVPQTVNNGKRRRGGELSAHHWGKKKARMKTNRQPQRGPLTHANSEKKKKRKNTTWGMYWIIQIWTWSSMVYICLFGWVQIDNSKCERNVCTCYVCCCYDLHFLSSWIVFFLVVFWLHVSLAYFC